jgi:hypothetical protein
MKKYICLVSGGKKIFACDVLPQDVEVAENQWKFRSFSFPLGLAISVSTDGVWVGPICVYDADAPDTPTLIVKHTFEHSMALVARRMQSRAGEILGDKAVQQLWNRMYANPRHPTTEFTRKGKIFSQLAYALGGICFRGE